MLFSGIAEPEGGGSSAAFFLPESAPCNSSVICLATALLMVSDKDGGEGTAGAWGGDVACRLSSVRMIAGAKITDTMASTKVSVMTNPTKMKIARANRESPLR